MDLNKVFLIGRLGKDPEIVQSQSNTIIAKFSLATSSSYQDKDGRTHVNTEWHNIKAFGKLAEVCLEYLKKGQMIHLEGKISSYRYETNGVNQKHVEIILENINFLSNQTHGFQGEDIPF